MRVRFVQGISPRRSVISALFVLAQQVLSANLKAKINTGQINRYKVCRHEICLSDLLYADDILIFTNGSERSIRNLMKLLKDYEQSSGQLINAAKSGFFLADKFQRREAVILRVTRMAMSDLPFIYLGVPLFTGRVKNIYFDHVIDKVRRAVDGWKAKLL